MQHLIEHEAARLQAAGMNQIDAYHYARQKVANDAARRQHQAQQEAALREAAQQNSQVLGGEKC